MRRIVLVYDMRSEYDRKVISGVAAFYRDRQRADTEDQGVLIQTSDVGANIAWCADGVIANLDHDAIAEAASKSPVPVVGFGTAGTDVNPCIPYFFADNQRISEMAAGHLLTQGLREFAYVSSREEWNEERERAFVSYVTARGYQCYRLRRKQPHSLGETLRRLPRPLGVMAANDECACEVVEACRLSGIDIPREVAVIGVDNNDLLCELNSPAISSIERGGMRIGYEAASVLDAMMANRKVQLRFQIQPAGVVVRQSTGMSRVLDPVVMRAMEFIDRHRAERLRSSDVISAFDTSDGMLECRFMSALGVSISAAIRADRLEHARHLVSSTRLPLKRIAAESGFSSVQHMTTLFRKTFAQSPARYRRSAVDAARKSGVEFLPRFSQPVEVQESFKSGWMEDGEAAMFSSNIRSIALAARRAATLDYLHVHDNGK